MSIDIRPAVAEDQATIRSIVRAAGIAPFGLDWPRFLVAEENGRIAGVGQVKPHRDGTRELASLAVIPEFQGQGIGAEIVRALIERETTFGRETALAGETVQGQNELLFLMCADPLEGYYRQFDFVRLEGREIPPSIGRLVWLGNLFARLVSIVSRRKMSIIVMSRPLETG